jgi:hypothetical protein
MNEKSQEIELLNQIIRDTSHKELVLLSEDSSTAKALGVTIDQKTISDSYFLKDKGFVYTRTESPFFYSVYRIYLEKDKPIREYILKKKDENAPFETKEYATTEYIQKYGKLPRASYTLDSVEQNGILYEILDEKSVTAIQREGNIFHLHINPKKIGPYLYRSIRNHGPFDSDPEFRLLEIDLHIRDGILCSIQKTMDYQIKWGFIKLNIHSTDKTDIHIVHNQKILLQGKERTIKIPEDKEDYSPIPREE